MEKAQAGSPSSPVTAWDPRGKASPGDPICSIVIPSYNGRALLERCLAAVFRHRPIAPRMPIEVIVADDGSTDDTLAWLAQIYPEVRAVRLAQNSGFCAAANAGLAAARAPFVQLLNNDAEPTEGWIEAGLAPFADALVGSVAPLVLFRNDPGRVDSAGDAYSPFGWPTKRGHGEPTGLHQGLADREVFGASGSSAFYRASALNKVGGYDPLLGAYYEDVDLAFRLRWAGYRCVHTPRCVLLHEVSASYDHRNHQLERRLSRNQELIFWWNMPRLALAVAFLPRLAFVVAQFGWRLVRGRALAFLAGKGDALRQTRAILDRRQARRWLSRSALARPRFPFTWGLFTNLRNHLTRPR